MDEMTNGADKLDSEDDMEERNRLIRLNGDDGTSSQEGSQESASGDRLPDVENAEPDLRRVKVRIRAKLFFLCCVATVNAIWHGSLSCRLAAGRS